jgi:hypothetical protein
MPVLKVEKIRIKQFGVLKKSGFGLYIKLNGGAGKKGI